MNDFDNMDNMNLDDDEEESQPLPTPLSKVDAPTPLSKIDAPYAYRDNSNYENIDMGGSYYYASIDFLLIFFFRFSLFVYDWHYLDDDLWDN